jgi:hypothetical protein
MRAIRLIALSAACAACGPRLVPSGYAKHDVLAFVQSHRAELQAEARIGSGPHLRDLGISAGCQNQPELDRRLRKNHDQVFAPASDAEVAERIVTTLTRTKELRCLDLELGREREHAAGLRHIGPRRFASQR